MKKILVFILAFSMILPLGLSLGATDEGYGEAETALGQFVDSFEDLDNVSIAVEVIRNSTLNAMELNKTGTVPDYLDLTTFTEVDPGNDMTVTAPRNTWTVMPRNVNNYLYYDFGAGFLDDFYYEFNVSISDVEAGDGSNAGIMSLFSVTDILGNVLTMRTGTDIMVQVIQNGGNDDKFLLAFLEYSGGVFQGGENSVMVHNIGTYYMIFDRSGALARLRVYSDKEHTTLLETLQYAASGDDNYRYLQVVSSFGGASDPNDHSSGYVEDVWNGTGGLGYASEGYFTTVDYLSDPLANGSALVHLTNTSIPDGTGILVEFSDDNSTWIFNDWQPIFGGFESIDLRDLSFSTGFYIRYNLSTTNASRTPRIYQSRLITTIGNVSEGKPGLNVTGEWIEYNLTQIGVLVGTLDDGNLNSTLDIDGDTYNVSEVVGVPGFRISFNWTDIPDNADCIWIEIYYHYDGNQAHDVDVELWNFTSSSWVFLGHIVDSVDFVWVNVSIYDLRIPNDFVNSSGAVLGRINHADAGNMNHDLFIEYLKLQAFVPSEVTPTISGANWGLLWFFLILICVPIALVLLKGSKR